MAAVLREVGGPGRPLDTGWLACDAPGSWADFGAGIGVDGPVEDDDLDLLVEFYGARGRPARVQLTPYLHPSLRRGLSARGFVLYEQETLLVRATADPPAVPDVPGLVLRPVDPLDDADVEAFVDVQMRGFYEGEPGPAAMEAITRRVARHPRCRTWLLELDGRVVGSGGLEGFEESAVLIAGAVVPEARRRGLQAALVAHRLRVARELGAEYVLVGSTPGGPTERNALRAGFGVAMTLIGVESRRQAPGSGY